jgi:hypothetical protein
MCLLRDGLDMEIGFPLAVGRNRLPRLVPHGEKPVPGESKAKLANDCPAGVDHW